MNERIALSLSPTGSNPARRVILPSVIEQHVARARDLRSTMIACLARQFWSWLTHRARSGRDCMDAELLSGSPARG